MRSAVFASALLLAMPAYAGNWDVDSATSKITFIASQSGEAFTGTLPAFASDITFDPEDLANAHIKITMPLAGTTTGSAGRDADLPNAEWFNVAAYPEAVFESSKVTAVDENGHYIAEGTLTLRGISQPIFLPFDLAIENSKALATGTVTFNRLLFEVGKGWPESSGVSENVEVQVELHATRAAEPAPVTP